MNKITKAASNIMQPESLEELIEQPNIEETQLAAGGRPTPLTQPMEAPKQEEPNPEQPTEPQIQKPQPPEGQPLPPNERVNAAYKLVYGEGAEIPIRHKSITTAQDADWFIRSYMGGLFATPNDNPLTQRFSNLEELLTWFDRTYPAQQQEERSE
ncbi:MAG TPA: hypothetical protein VK211_23450 [Kamptonema sp.]|nr:hypothetical protein [Kamptonema sp.]